MSFRHPKGLYLLFMTEMWERFSFYTMQALLVLYATAALAEGGLAMNSAKAIALFGYYGAAVYIMPLLGAYFADRKIGLQRAVIIGGVLMAIGHFLMVFNQELTFYLALAFLAAGNGFFKPCITSLLGCLYDDQPQGKDSAYSIFYMGINVGALLAGIVGGALHVYYGFDYAFGTAGIGMCIGLATFLWGRKRYLGNVGLEPIVKHEEAATVSLTSEEKRRIWGLMSVCLFMTAFFIGYWQYGGAMTLYAESYTDRMLGSFEVPTAWFFSLNPLFIILCCPIMGIVWSRLGTYSSVCLDIRKILVGFGLTASSFALIWWGAQGANPETGVKSHMMLLVVYYLLITVGEYCIVPVAQALVSKIAPKRYLSRMMSAVLFAIGVASIGASYLGAYIETMEASEVFRLIFFVLSGFTALLSLAYPWIERACGFRDHESCETFDTVTA